MFSNDACNNYSILLTSLYRGGSEGESDEKKSVILRRMEWGKNTRAGVKMVEHLHENVFMHRGERYT